MTFKPLLFYLKQPFVWLKGIIAQQPTAEIQEQPELVKIENGRRHYKYGKNASYTILDKTDK